MAELLYGEGWQEFSRCKEEDVDPDSLFVLGAAQNKAARICDSCPVKVDCLADALDHHEEFGVWGGMTERERRALLRQHPDVVSWRRQFMAQTALRRTVGFGREAS